MSRYLVDLTPAQIVYLDEASVHKPYIYLGQDPYQKCLLLRYFALVAKRMHSSNVGHYEGSEVDQWYENESTGFLSLFDAATRNALLSTTRCYSDYTIDPGGTVSYPEIARRAFCLNYKEVGGGGSETGIDYLGVLKTVMNTTNANTARICKNENDSAVYYWLGSGPSASQFGCVSDNGHFRASNATLGNSWQRPAISVDPSTIVSDAEGADDSIFLLPDGRRTYWEINATCLLGSSAERPKKAKLMVAETQISEASYQVSNNAKDANPTWVNCQNGGVCDLANTGKETTDYELGVKIHAKSGVYSGHVGEPVLIVEKEES